MAFNGTEGSEIDPNKAAEWTRTYRKTNPEKIKGYFAGREILERILAQPDCMGIRFYFGLSDGITKLVGVGADSNENDQLAAKQIVADDFCPCPNRCSTDSILNN